MPITDKQREERRSKIYSSDMAAILNINPYMNAHDVWLEKTGRVQNEEEKEYMYAGTMFEDGVLKYAESELGPLRRNQYRVAQGFPLASHIDALVVENGKPVEAKTAGLFGPLQDEWGDNYTDEIPDHMIIQCHVHMICSVQEVCYVPAFLGGRGFLMYHINRDKEIADTIMDASFDFWECVEKDEPPANIIPSVNFVKRIKRIPEKTVPLDQKLVDEYTDAKDKLKWAEQLKEDAYAAILSALGDAEAGELPDGSMMTFFEQIQRRIDSTRLKEEMPDIAAKFMKELRFRVLRHKKPKKGK